MDTKLPARSRLVKRSDPLLTIDAAPVEANLIKLKTPSTISLVDYPANQIAFKVLRSDKGAKKVAQPVIRRAKRSDPGPVLRLVFPEGVTEEVAKTSLAEFGMEGYRIEVTDQAVIAIRADLKSVSPENTTDIKLNAQGLIATIARADTPAPAGELPYIALVRVEFDATKFDQESVKRWTEEKSIDGTLKPPQNAGESYVVSRSEVQDKQETRCVTLDEGVTGVIVRSDVVLIPDYFVAAINEAAYGYWGWGQLDFNASLANENFCADMREASDVLDNILRDIVLYSELPLDVRKELALKTLAQYGDYMSSIMDSLPRQLLVSVAARSANTQQEKLMSNSQVKGTTVADAKRDDPVKPADDVKVEPTVAALTRADVQSMIDEGFAKLQVKLSTNNDDAKKDDKKAEGVVADTASLTRADLISAMGEIMKPITERMALVEGLTVVRSAQETAPAPVEEEGKTKDVFRGAFPGLRKVSKQ